MLYNQGVVLTKIQHLLGHKSVSTTERYLGVKFEETREAILMLDEPLAQALSVSGSYKPIAQLPEASSQTP
jgi:integrase